MNPVVEFRNLSYAYNTHLALEDINITVEENDFWGIVGPNGGGKTTLLRLILGFLRPTIGEVKVFGGDPDKVRPQIGYVPQHSEFDRDFPILVADVVLMGRLRPGSLFNRFTTADYQAAQTAMTDVNVHQLRNRKFGTLSGGEMQRVLIARALATAPRLLILDEPTASVDSHLEHDIYELLRRLNQKTTIILVSHDLGFISAYVNNVACLNRRLVSHRPDQISKEMIDEAYRGNTHMLQHHCEV